MFQDVHLSGSLDEACRLMHLSGIVRQAIRFVKGLEIRLLQGETLAAPVFEMAVFSVLPWFKVRECTASILAGMRLALTIYISTLPHLPQVRERYELGGQPSSWRRRDLRRGATLLT